MFEFAPVGYVRCSSCEVYQLPFQVNVISGMSAFIELNSGCNYEEALTDLEGVERIWIVFVFHRANSWKPKVTPPRGGQKRSLFATRSPHRPNPVGISSVKLKSINGLKIEIEDHDLLDGTPVLDIKPYIPYADSFSEATAGWLDSVDPPKIFNVSYSINAQNKLVWLAQKGVDLKSLVDVSLKLKPRPEKGNRIKENETGYEIAVKTWRLSFTISDFTVLVEDVYSGYSKDYLNGSKKSRWDDVPLHCLFNQTF